MISLTREPIDTEAVLRSVQHPEAGAVVSFDGRVRNHSKGRQVTHLYYEAYPEMAEKELAKILTTAFSRWSLQTVNIVHRMGRLEIGDSSVFIAVSSAHRAEAFAACRFIIDSLKESVPIWKKEYFEDGEVWVEQ